MADLRYLLAIYVHAHRTGSSVPPHIDAEARWHLGLPVSDEPAVPQGREPAAVITEPSDEEWDALVERVWDKYQTVGYQGERFMYDGDFGSALDLVRKELSRWGHQPAPPADGEVAELVAALRTDAECVAAEQPDLMQLTDKQLTRAADLLECLEQVAYAASDFIRLRVPRL